MYNIYMDLGYKTLNNLTSKDNKLQKSAASLIINSKDTRAFEILCEKSEILFDFIKEKVVNNLISEVNQNNILNLFSFMKSYSDDFKDFIIKPFIKFNSKEIEDKMFDLIKNGTDNEKIYAVLYFSELKNDSILPFIKEFIKSDNIDLKKNSIEFLKKFNIKDEFNIAVNTLKNSKNDFDKMEAVEFLSFYKDKSSFEYIYNYFIETNSEYLIFSLLSIKDIEELIKENKEDEILNILSAIFYNFPNSISYDDFSSYLNFSLFDFLMETDNDYIYLLVEYIKNKLSYALNSEEYSIDLDKNSKKQVQESINNLEAFAVEFDRNEAIINTFDKNVKIQTLVALELTNENQKEIIENLVKNTNDNEIMCSGIYALKRNGILSKEFLGEIEDKISNETIKYELQNYCS